MSEVFEVFVCFKTNPTAVHFLKCLESKGYNADIRKVNPDAVPV